MRIRALLVAVAVMSPLLAMPVTADAKHHAKKHHHKKHHKKHHKTVPAPSPTTPKPSPTTPVPSPPAAGPSPTTPAPTTPPPAASNVPVGYYQCFHSFADSGSTTGYDTNSPGSFTLSAGGSYQESLKGQAGQWSSTGNSIAFTGGGFDAAGEHDTGSYVPEGATMPHNQINDGSMYTIVIQGSAGNTDTEPPATESDSSTYWYCKLRP